MRERLFRGRIRTSTAILAVIFVVTLVVYLLVRPLTTQAQQGTGDSSAKRKTPAATPSTVATTPARPTPSPSSTPSPTTATPGTPSPTATASGSATPGSPSPSRGGTGDPSRTNGAPTDVAPPGTD